ncbi:MAG: hypothetical protein U9N51_07525 [Bacteroidota bacterium]|nr:hypothetical protein [Bacteroidota bacterium]
MNFNEITRWDIEFFVNLYYKQRKDVITIIAFVYYIYFHHVLIVARGVAVQIPENFSQNAEYSRRT